ncbi:MAG: hypothetical protein OYH77_07200 [Pseudomonadota bacterium]|nr:hypothetical protein [Pseudomonadota bacterium]
MNIFTSMNSFGHEQVLFCRDKNSSLNAIISIHDTTLGPALGGCRIWNYQDHADALHDVLRLSRGMTYKAALAGLPLGGGKSVIIADPKTADKPSLLRALGQHVEYLHGRYITSQDVSVSNSDLCHIRTMTKHVVGLPADKGGTGDPSPHTAMGVLHGIKAAVRHKLNRSDLHGISVAVQGCGNVGKHLCHLLHHEGAKLYISDISVERARQVADECQAETVDKDAIISLDVDVFSPCALGAVISKKSIPKLKAKIVAGGANNQLTDEEGDDLLLREHGILYAPDYIVNAGGLISVSYEVEAIDKTVPIADRLTNIYSTLLEIFSVADTNGAGTGKTANKVAEKRITSYASKMNSAS